VAVNRTTIDLATALRPRSESALALPDGPAAFWQLATAASVLAPQGTVGTAARAAMAGAHADSHPFRPSAKQARPPRGVPR
jgi:hypothetical protein